MDCGNWLSFPYSLSFIVTGVVWSWIFNPETGVNVLFDVTGLNSLLGALGVGPLPLGWLTDPQVVLSLNDALARIFPAAACLQVQLGIPLALIPTTMAAAWQLSCFAMAMYLAGLGAIPVETREAARVDGANEWQVYLPDPDNRVTLGPGGSIRIRWRPNNLTAHRKLIQTARQVMRRAG